MQSFKLNPSFEFTNDISYQHSLIGPYADCKNVAIFKDLQALESIGLVAPVGENHMYFAVMNSKECRLTEIGRYYRRLVNKKRKYRLN